MISPCKDCEKRHPACHDHCEAYREWVQPFRENQKERTIYNTIRSYADSPMGKASRKKLNKRKKMGL